MSETPAAPEVWRRGEESVSGEKKNEKKKEKRKRKNPYRGCGKVGPQQESQIWPLEVHVDERITQHIKEIAQTEHVLAHRLDEAIFSLSAGGQRPDLELVIHGLGKLSGIHLATVLLERRLPQQFCEKQELEEQEGGRREITRSRPILRVASFLSVRRMVAERFCMRYLTAKF